MEIFKILKCIVKEVFIVLLSMFCLVTFAQENRGFTEGKILGSQQKDRPAPTAASVEALIPGYTQGMQNQNLYNPNGDLKAAAAARKADCAANPGQNGSLARAKECEALNYLGNNSANASSLRANCIQYTGVTDQSKLPLECQTLPAVSIQGAGVTSVQNNPFAAGITGDASVQKYQTIDFTGERARSGVAGGSFKGCIDETVQISPAKFNAQSCEARDPNVTAVKCSWSPTLGQTASCAHLENNPLCEARKSGPDVEPPSCLKWSPTILPDPTKPNAPPPPPPVCLSMNTNFACSSGVREPMPGCGAGGSLDRCKPWGEPTCKEWVGRTCIHSQQEYQCETQAAVSRTSRNCSGQQYCIGDNCLDTPQTDSTKDMMAVVGTMEAVRQAGNYQNCNTSPAALSSPQNALSCASGDFQIFKGEANFCTKKLLKNCCADTKGTVSSNRTVLTSVIFAAAPYLGNEAVLSISSYTYDFMYNNGLFTEFAAKGLQSIGGEIISQSITTSYGTVFGITAWGGTTAPTGLFGGSLTQMGSIGGFNFAFDPYSLMLTVALQVIMEMISCEQSDMVTNQKNAGRLCKHVGSFCSKRLPIIGTCIENKESYCCYNSRLATIIQKSILTNREDVKNPMCSGITPDQFSNLNFENIDMAEFYDEIKPANFEASISASGQGLTDFTNSRSNTITASPPNIFAPQPAVTSVPKRP